MGTFYFFKCCFPLTLSHTLGSTPSSFHLSSPAHSLPFCFNFLLQRIGTNSQHPPEQSGNRIYLKSALCYHSNENFKMIQLNSKIVWCQNDTREQMSYTVMAIGMATWGIIQNCLIFTGLMSHSWIWSCMIILYLFQPCALWFCSQHIGCYDNAMQFPVHKVLLTIIWGIINMGWCINPGEINLSPLWQHVREIDTLCQSVFSFLLFLLTLSLSLTLSVSVPVFFHTLSLSLGTDTFIFSLGDWRCHCGKCLSASPAAAEPCGFDKPHLIGRKPGGFERTETSTKLLLSGII